MTSNPKNCFVISPIGKEESDSHNRAELIFDYIIKPVVDKCGYQEPLRSDKISTPGIITSQILRHLIEDDLVIADLSTNNPNVMYELGIRHSTRKPVIQIIDENDLEKLPFDIRQIRTIPFDISNLKSVDKCKKEMLQQISSLEEDSNQFESPIFGSLSSLSQNNKELFSSLKEIMGTLETMRSDSDNLRWASEALRQAKLRMSSQSLFAERSAHYHDEKMFVADQFVPFLLSRCKKQIELGKKVFLLVDSGTTLYPFFERLGRMAVRLFENGERWIDKLVILTNNLPGVETLMDVGRKHPNSRYSQLAIECHLLPGVPLPLYSATTGPETEQALKSYKNNNSNMETVFIGLITGNWIRLRRTSPYCPIALARGKWHKDFKQVLIDNSDEVYVITPLGKIFMEIDPSDVNWALGLDSNSNEPDREPYNELEITEKANIVKLISTSRHEGYVLSELSRRLTQKLKTKAFNVKLFTAAPIEVVPHILFPFDNLPRNWDLQIKTEFPHSYVRREETLTQFFFVPPLPVRPLR